MIKYISFDLDGTIMKRVYADAVWLEGLPKVYAEQYNIPYHEAREYIIKEYDKISENRIEWYDISYWYSKFKLKHNWMDLLRQYSDRVEAYPEAMDVIKRLSKCYPLIILSNAKKEFIDVQLHESGLYKYFKYVFSSTSDFNMMKRSTSFYSMICDKLKIKPCEMIHIGDHQEFDYYVPRSLGIVSFHLDRVCEYKGENVVHDLEEFEERLQRIMTE